MLYANANLPELVERNVRDSVLLASEMQHEAGDDYIEAKEDHAFILRKYLGRMEERNFSLLLRVLYPELSPRKQLVAALADLNLKGSVTNQDQAEKEIEKARETIVQFVAKSQKFSDMQMVTSEHEELPDWLLEDARTALEDSRECVEIYGNDLTFGNAQEACRRNRKAIALAYLVRSAYQHFNSLDGELRQFQGDINRTIYYHYLLVKNNEDALNDDRILDDVKKRLEKDHHLLVKYTDSELRRLEIVDAILDKDNHRAYNCLRATIGISGLE